jgi:Taurine catabolism dioxygenase TauD, TfdA family
MAGGTPGRSLNDLIIDLGAAAGELTGAVSWLEARWPAEDLRDPAIQVQASAGLTERIPLLTPLFRRARDTAADAGAVILRGVPTRSDAMLIAVSSLLGPVQVIRPGLPLVDDLMPAATEAEAIRNADSRRTLSPHTDSSDLASAPDFFLILGCVYNSDPAGGGESILVFVDEVARELRRIGAARALDLLQDQVFPSLNLPAAAGKAPVIIPVLARRSDGTLTARFRAEALRAGLESPAAEATPPQTHQQALADFTCAVLSPALQRRVRLTEGDLLVADNGRVMHGRAVISDGVRRHLKRTFAKRPGSSQEQAA